MIDTVVVGAGIGGLATAAFLAGAGHEVTVYESHSAVAPGSAVFLQPNGQAVLRALGALDELSQQGSMLPKLRLLDDRLRVIAEVDPPGSLDNSRSTLVVPKSAIIKTLSAAAAKAGARLVADTPLVEIEGSPASPKLHFGDEIITASLVVGADGATSMVRELFDDDVVEVRQGRAFLASIVQWDSSPELVGEYWTRKGLAGIVPCGAGQTHLYATATSAIVRAADGQDLSGLRRSLAGAHPPLLQVVNAIGSIDQVSITTSESVSVNQLYQGGVALVGDAARSFGPSLTHGTNGALIDAAVLASEIGRRHDLAAALAAYDARRCPAVQRATVDASWLGRLAHFTHGRRLRNAGLRMVPTQMTEVAARRAAEIDPLAFQDELETVAS